MSITPTISRIALSFILVAASSNLSALRAQPVAPNAPASSPTVVARAEGHFKRGVELYNEGNAEAAMVEFRRAYDLAPRFQILYNMGQVAYALNDYAAAVDLFERYLSSGGSGVPEERRKSVTEDIKRLRSRIGRIQVVSDVQGARLAIDDVPMGVITSAPVAVNIGRRKLTLSVSDGRSGTQFVDVPAGEPVVARFTLRKAANAEVSLQQEQATAATSSRDGLSTGAIVAWSVAGGMALGALASGAYALKRAGDLEDAKGAYPVEDPKSLEELDNSVSRSAMIADGFLIGAAVSGAVALWLTLRDGPQPAEASLRRSLTSTLTPTVSLTGISMQGRF